MKHFVFNEIRLQVEVVRLNVTFCLSTESVAGRGNLMRPQCQTSKLSSPHYAVDCFSQTALQRRYAHVLSLLAMLSYKHI